MKSWKTLVVALAVGFAGAAAQAGDGAPARMDPDPSFLKEGETRTFAITYTAKLKDIPVETKRLRVWVPVPQDTAVQTIKDLAFQGAIQPKQTTEKRFGNRLAYYEIENPTATMQLAPGAKTFEWAVTYSFTCARKEVVTDLSKLGEDGEERSPAAAEFLKDDRLTFVDDRVRKLAEEATAGKKGTLEKARAIYEKVYEHMTYDKNHQGWGRGDVRHACDVGNGNCTDFHAMFMALCRAQGIPAGFEIGLYPPYTKNADEKLGGYHCWAWFRVPGKTWVPVDISEADRFPERKDFLFGGHTSNRVTLSVGRDLILEPKQDGDPVNFLLNPYAEADGKSVPTSKDWTLKDMP